MAKAKATPAKAKAPSVAAIRKEINFLAAATLDDGTVYALSTDLQIGDEPNLAKWRAKYPNANPTKRGRNFYYAILWKLTTPSPQGWTREFLNGWYTSMVPTHDKGRVDGVMMLTPLGEYLWRSAAGQDVVGVLSKKPRGSGMLMQTGTRTFAALTLVDGATQLFEWTSQAWMRVGTALPGTDVTSVCELGGALHAICRKGGVLALAGKAWKPAGLQDEDYLETSAASATAMYVVQSQCIFIRDKASKSWRRIAIPGPYSIKRCHWVKDTLYLFGYDHWTLKGDKLTKLEAGTALFGNRFQDATLSAGPRLCVTFTDSIEVLDGGDWQTFE